MVGQCLSVLSSMSPEVGFYAFCYELIIEADKRWPRLFLPFFFGSILAYCRPYWQQWQIKQTLEQVDEQAEAIVEQWERQEREEKTEALIEKAEELFPQSTILPVEDAPIPSVMIITEAPPEASDDVKALGGELRITYKLGDS